MTLSKSARYALYAALEMARAEGGLVTAAAVAARYRVPPTAAAKVFQQLVRAGLAEGVRGVGGGYRLARPRSRITVLDVLSVFEPSLREPVDPMAGHGGAATPVPAARTRPQAPPDTALAGLLSEVDELVRCTFASVTLATLVRRERGR
jgi:Rrf2 family iron-sulfur cluster assembly transcriptional regulator